MASEPVRCQLVGVALIALAEAGIPSERERTALFGMTSASAMVRIPIYSERVAVRRLLGAGSSDHRSRIFARCRSRREYENLPPPLMDIGARRALDPGVKLRWRSDGLLRKA